MKKKRTGFFHTVYRHVMNFLNKSYEDNIAALSGQSAFFLILSSVPLVMFIFALLLILTGKSISDGSTIIHFDTDNSVILFLEKYIVEAAKRATSGTAVITAIMTLWSAGRGLYCITEGISRIYRLPNKRIWLMKRVFAMGYTVVMLIMLILGFAVFVLNFLVSQKFSQFFGENVFLNWLTGLLNPIVLEALQLVIMTLALKFYLRGKVEEKRYYSFRALFPGMLFTVIIWHIVNYGVSLYLQYFSASSIYGSLGTAAILMIWMYILMFVLLYGIQLNYIYRDTFSGLKKLQLRKPKE